MLRRSRRIVEQRNEQSRQVYTPLDISNRHNEVATRIVKLHPKISQQGRIQITLEPFFIPTDEARNPPEDYMALSYVWGTDQVLHTIEVNGKDFQIRQNLWYALSHLQNVASSLRLIWIDALCINQCDDSEKNHQVSFMGSIYNQASKVLVWLGKDLEIYDRMLNVGTNMVESMPEGEGDFDLETFPELFASALARNSWTEEEWFASWRNFLHIDYWSRAWVTQEFRLAKSLLVLTETHAISEPMLMAMWFASLASTKLEMDDIYTGSTSRSAFQRLLIGRSQHARLQTSSCKGRPKIYGRTEPWETFNMAAMLRCSDIRDRIYSQLSLLEGGQDFHVDYGEDALTLFLRTVLFCYERGGREERMCRDWGEVGLALGLARTEVYHELRRRSHELGPARDHWAKMRTLKVSYTIPIYSWADPSTRTSTCPSCKESVRKIKGLSSPWQFCCLGEETGFHLGSHLFLPITKHVDPTSRYARTVVFASNSGIMRAKIVQPLPVRTESGIQLCLVTCLMLSQLWLQHLVRCEEIVKDGSVIDSYLANTMTSRVVWSPEKQ